MQKILEIITIATKMKNYELRKSYFSKCGKYICIESSYQTDVWKISGDYDRKKNIYETNIESKNGNFYLLAENSYAYPSTYFIDMKNKTKKLVDQKGFPIGFTQEDDMFLTCSSVQHFDGFFETELKLFNFSGEVVKKTKSNRTSIKSCYFVPYSNNFSFHIV